MPPRAGIEPRNVMLCNNIIIRHNVTYKNGKINKGMTLKGEVLLLLWIENSLGLLRIITA
jgi:hypothetical protein